MASGSSKDLSSNRLPLPVVLTVGDERFFSSEAWAGVVEQAADAREDEAAPEVEREPITWEQLEPILEQPHEQSAELLRERGWGRCERSATRQPLPLQLTHEHEPVPKHLHPQVRRVLDLFDVWGVVASAGAGQVDPLRDALHGIDVPLLVTTDSTTVPDGPQPANELRMMPSNRAQARAMLSTAVMGFAEVHDTRRGVDPTVLMGPPRIAYSWDATPQANEYVDDLLKELKREADRLEISLEKYDEEQDHQGPVIVVGYQSHAKELIHRRSRSHVTILSDGCATDAMRTAVVDELGTAAQYWFITSPDLSPRRIGRKAFSAIAGAGRRTLTWDPASDSERELPRTSRRDVIKRMLKRTDESHFDFVGIENVALAYRVMPIEQKRARGGQTPPLEDEHPQGPSKVVSMEARRAR